MYFSKMRFMPDVVNIPIFFYLDFFIVRQEFFIEVIFQGRFVVIVYIHTAELFLSCNRCTRMKLDYNSSATIVCDRILDAIL